MTNYELRMTNCGWLRRILNWANLGIRHSSFVIRHSILLACFFAVLAFSTDKVDSWLMFRGSSALTGVSSVELPKAPRLLWSFEAEDSIESSAAISGNMVYVASMDSSLYAIELSTGKLRWRYSTSAPVQESSPGIREGTVFLGDIDGVFHAVNANTGDPIWTFRAEAEIRSSPNFSGDKVFFGSYDQNLYCLSAKTGDLVWKFTTEGPVHATPSIDKEHVYISGCDGAFRAIALATGEQDYEINLGAYAGASAALREHYAYVGTFANEVLCLNLQKRLPEWTYRHPTRSFPFYSSAAVTHDRVVLGGRDKLIHCLDRSSGTEIWSFITRARVESSPLVTDSSVFVGSNDGVLYSLDLISGKKIWEFTSGAPFSASPAAAAGHLVIGDQDGVLYCFGN